MSPFLATFTRMTSVRPALYHVCLMECLQAHAITMTISVPRSTYWKLCTSLR